MSSIYDVVSLIMFAGVALLFLQRSAASEADPVPLWRYAVAAAGCAAGDVMGNNNHPVEAVATLAVTVAFGVAMLKPFKHSST